MYGKRVSGKWIFTNIEIHPLHCIKQKKIQGNEYGEWEWEHPNLVINLSNWKGLRRFLKGHYKNKSIYATPQASL